MKFHSRKQSPLSSAVITKPEPLGRQVLKQPPGQVGKAECMWQTRKSNHGPSMWNRHLSYYGQHLNRIHKSTPTTSPSRSLPQLHIPRNVYCQKLAISQPPSTYFSPLPLQPFAYPTKLLFPCSGQPASPLSLRMPSPLLTPSSSSQLLSSVHLCCQLTWP